MKRFIAHAHPFCCGAAHALPASGMGAIQGTIGHVHVLLDQVLDVLPCVLRFFFGFPLGFLVNEIAYMEKK